MTLLLGLILSAPAVTAARDLTTIEKSHITAAVGEKLKDAESARYTWPKWDRSGTYCGTVNAKNSYGGYIGYVPYLALVDSRQGKVGTFVYVMLGNTDPRDPETSTVIAKCTEAGYGTG